MQSNEISSDKDVCLRMPMNFIKHQNCLINKENLANMIA